MTETALDVSPVRTTLTVVEPAFSVVLAVVEAKLTKPPTGITVIVNDCGGEVSTPPLAAPPLSLATIVIVAVPPALDDGVQVSVPAELIAGPELKRAEFVLLVIWKVMVWLDSFAGPDEMFVAQLDTVTKLLLFTV